MHRLTRISVLAAGMASLVLVSVSPAVAGGWFGGVECGQQPNPGCELGAGRGGQAPRNPRPYLAQPARPRHPGGNEHTGGRVSPKSDSGDSILGGRPNSANCSYTRSDYQPPSQQVQAIVFHFPHAEVSAGVQLVSRAAGHGSLLAAQSPVGAGGAWYTYRCSNSGVRDALYRAPVWIPDGPAAQPVAVPSPQELAAQARSQLRLPRPSIAANPAGTQLVRLPTWLWLDRHGWARQSATASVPGVSVTAVATPRSVSWSMGDGSTVTCAGRGTPFPAGGDPRGSSPDCGHTYQRSSAGEPDTRFPVTATVHWTVTWSGAGSGGMFGDLTTQAAASFRVAQAQALGTRRR